MPQASVRGRRYRRIASGDLGRAALLDEPDRVVQVDIGPRRDLARRIRVVTHLLEGLRAPPLDPLAFGLD